MSIKRKTETHFHLQDDAGIQHRITQTVIDVQANGLLGGPTDIWEESSRAHALSDGTLVQSNDDEDDTYTAFTSPKMRLRQLKPRV